MAIARLFNAAKGLVLLLVLLAAGLGALGVVALVLTVLAWPCLHHVFGDRLSWSQALALMFTVQIAQLPLAAASKWTTRGKEQP